MVTAWLNFGVPPDASNRVRPGASCNSPRPLPDEPPDEFQVTTEEAGAAANDSAVRARYWQKLRNVWVISGAWHEQYEWNTIVLRQSLQSAGQWLESTIRRITG